MVPNSIVPSYSPYPYVYYGQKLNKPAPSSHRRKPRRLICDPHRVTQAWHFAQPTRSPTNNSPPSVSPRSPSTNNSHQLTPIPTPSESHCKHQQKNSATKAHKNASSLSLPQPIQDRRRGAPLPHHPGSRPCRSAQALR